MTTALVVEDGTGVPGANSYCSAQMAMEYHGQRGTGPQWIYVVDQQASIGMLVDATRLLESTYDWVCPILTLEQGLTLPGQDILLDDGRTITSAQQVAMAADAVAWLALRLFYDQNTSGVTGIKSERLPDYEVEYDGEKQVHYPAVDAMLGQIVARGGLSGGIIGAGLVRWS